MQIIIPAAGKGSRLGPLTKNQTKCQVEINGESLISRALKNISLTNVKKVVIIIGFEGEKLKKSIGNKFKDIEDLISIDEPLEISLKFKDKEKWITKSLSITMRTPGHDKDLVRGF